MRVFLLAVGLVVAGMLAAGAVSENVYEGELVSFPGAWAFTLGRAHIILVSDEELEQLANPDTVLDLSLTFDKREASLRQICEQAQRGGQRTLIIAFDHFFSQYRPGQEGKPRRLTPDMKEYVERIAAISQFAAEYGLGLELSLLSPLEIGPAYEAATGESGVWMHYRKGLRDPETGRYSVQFWKQRGWANNKGPIRLEDAGVRVFAFQEDRIGGTPYLAVNPKGIVEITETVQVEEWPGSVSGGGEYEAVRTRVYGEGMTDIGPLDRVFVVQQYRTPEMDYFSESALPYLTALGDQYADAGVRLNGLYSDEMHIQQDWHYHVHHDHGEFALRYVSPGLARVYAEQYGAQYADFAKYMIYFTRGQEDFRNDLRAKSGDMHVFGGSPQAIRETALFRARYYKLLQDGVVELFTAAKRHLEERMGHTLETRAHATWAESPTIDKWDTGSRKAFPQMYEYTSNFVWSNTVQQAASACHDYFKWGEYLTGTGNDHAEGGWLDRNYTGLALACSTGIINEVPYSYGAHWGMPGEVHRRRQSLVNAFGAAAWWPYALVEGVVHRNTPVLMLYPLDLVAVDERFGSWMGQYAYANSISQSKLLEMGQVHDGAIQLAGRQFTTLVAQFEPFPQPGLLDMMGELVAQGGKVVWAGPPPVIGLDGQNALDAWQELFGVTYTPGKDEGIMAPGHAITFDGPLAPLAPMTVLTDFLVDRVYPVIPTEATVLARTGSDITGTQRATESGGEAVFLGFRPRDDQSASLGYETRYWFDILNTFGAYPGADHPEAVSRTGDYMACSFPNGTVAIARHLRRLVEDWPGGFARNREEDKVIEAGLDLPTEELGLEEYAVAGHTVTYGGKQCVAFRTDDAGNLIGFAGHDTNRIVVDGVETVYADAPIHFASWGPVEESRRVDPAVRLQLYFAGQGTVRIPAPMLTGEVELVAQGATPGSRGEVIPVRLEGERLVFEVGPGMGNRWLFALQK